MPDSAIIEKIRKLHALSERAGTEAEAANAATRVRELLEKHNLDIGTIELKAEPGTSARTRGLGQKKEHYAILATVCNELFDVQCYLQCTPRQQHFYAFVGLKANVEAACMTLEYLIDSVESILEFWKEQEQGLFGGFFHGKAQLGRKDYRAFRIGAARRIHDRVIDEKQRAAQASVTTRELVLIGNSVAKRMISEIEFDSTFKPDFKATKEQYALAAGYEYGARVDLKPKKRIQA
jgi:hypothetical protein